MFPAANPVVEKQLCPPGRDTARQREKSVFELESLIRHSNNINKYTIDKIEKWHMVIKLYMIGH